MIKRYITSVVKKILIELLPAVLIELDKNKHYVLVVPDGLIPEDELRISFEELRGHNIVVLSATGVKLLEVT